MPISLSIAVSCALIVLCPMGIQAKKTQSVRTDAFSPEKQLAGFAVPEGFVIELVASEKDGIINPIDLTFDASGRLWTQTAKMYPLDPVKNIKWGDLLKLMNDPAEQEKNAEFKRIKDLYQGKTRGEDSILVLSDFYGTNKKPKVATFADGMTIPQSILPYKNGLYVAQGSELFYLSDEDGDGKADKRDPLLTGFGFTDTHTMAHSLVRAPGGWIHFSHGALNMGNVKSLKSNASIPMNYSKTARFSLDGKKIELVNAGLNNIWGLQLRGNGQWYVSEANDQGFSITPTYPLTAFKGIGNDKLRPYQPFMPPLHKFRVGGTGLSGIAFPDDTSGSFPEEFCDVAFLANPITSSINCVKIIRNPDGTVTAEHLPDLLKSEDDWFRPVNIEFGPDGCLYIADWYNKIVSHNEVPTGHPDRDKSHGRIWRIRHVSQKARDIPNLYQASETELLAYLTSESLWQKREAAFQIIDRKLDAIIPAIKKIILNENLNATSRIHALWALEGLGAWDEELIQKILLDPNPYLRKEAVRSLTSFDVDVKTANKLLSPLIEDHDVIVRYELLHTLENLGKANLDTIDILVSFCHPTTLNNTIGKGYTNNFERYLARRALEKYPKQLEEFLKSEKVEKHSFRKLLWAQQALPKPDLSLFEKNWAKLKEKPIDKDTLNLISAQLEAFPESINIISPTFSDTTQALHIAKIATEEIAEIYHPSLKNLLQLTSDTLMKEGSQPSKEASEKLVAAYRLKPENFAKNKFLDDTPVSVLKKSQHGLNHLVQLLKKNKITSDQLDYETMQLLRILYNKDKAVHLVHEEISKKHSKQIKSSLQRIPKIETSFSEKKGNIETGKILFKGMCMSCHAVGEEGVNIGPALDGSANRDVAHLLTAIFNPSAAIESAYVKFVVIEKSGRIFTGLKTSDNTRGIILTQAGGLELFIPRDHIARSLPLGGQSFMPDNLFANLPDETVIDILSYIKTLK